MKRALTILAVATVAALGLAAPAAAQTLAGQVAGLTVAAEHRAGYDRDLFGDYDRDAILARNFAAFPSCDGYFSRYDGQCYEVGGGTSKAEADDEVDVDHRVALQEAWQSGAHAWGGAKLDRFGGDPTNLSMLTDNVNSSKGGAGIAEFTPSDAVCHYVSRYVATKVEYGLSVDSAEKATLVDLAGRCGGDNGGNGDGDGQPGNGGRDSGGKPDDTDDGTTQTSVVPEGGVDTGDGSLADRDGNAAVLLVVAFVAVGGGTLWGLKTLRSRA